VRSDARHQLRHLPDRCRQQHQIGVGNFCGHILADTIDDSELLRMYQSLRAAPETHYFANRARLAQCQRKRAADQADTEDDDFFEFWSGHQQSLFSFYPHPDLPPARGKEFDSLPLAGGGL
jgi:hypothetical protein